MMSRTHLHLIDGHGQTFSVSTRTAPEAALAWALQQFPRIDPALLAEWAEDVAKAKDTRRDTLEPPRRARGKVSVPSDTAAAHLPSDFRTLTCRPDTGGSPESRGVKRGDAV